MPLALRSAEGSSDEENRGRYLLFCLVLLVAFLTSQTPGYCDKGMRRAASGRFEKTVFLIYKQVCVSEPNL